MKVRTDGYWLTILHDGRSTSYPLNRYTPKQAWKDFYRTLCYYGEA